ncbi:MAG: hypothetical protein R6W80_13485 [Haliea sp.]
MNMNKNKLAFLLVSILIFLPMKAWAVDLSGTISNANGDPVCALVLASGRTVFSCNPRGPFSLSGLPLENDGSVNLQVYAAGFLPFFKNLTSFEPQEVRMTRAGGAPVDDGLSGGTLNGTYSLLRVSVFFNDGRILDSSARDFSVEGSMTIEGNRLTQTLVVSANGQASGTTLSGTFVDFGNFVRFTNSATRFTNDLVVVQKGSKVITELNANASGENFSETDQWAKVSNSPTALSNAASVSYSNGYVGGLAAQIVHLTGLNSVGGRVPERSLETE